MGRWRGFLDSLATTGGHIFGLYFLIVFGVVILVFSESHGSMKGAEMGAGMEGVAIGALMMMYKPSGTNAEQIARAGAPYQPPQPPPAALQPPIVVGDPPLPESSSAAVPPRPDWDRRPEGAS